MNSDSLELLSKPHWKPMGVPMLSPARTGIWRLPLSLYPRLATRIATGLSPGELQRMDRYRQLSDRMRYAVGRLGLRLLLSAYLNRPPGAISLLTDTQGKPHLPGADLHFNVSHCRDWVLIALGCHRLGVDIEHVNEKFAIGSVLSACFSAREIRFIESDAAERIQRFFLLWTRKEAFLKQVGCGLIDALNALEVLEHAKIPNQANALVRDELTTTPVIKSFFINRDYVGSICQHPEPMDLEFREFDLNHFEFPA